MADKVDPTTHMCSNRGMKMSWNKDYFGPDCPYECGFSIAKTTEKPE